MLSNRVNLPKLIYRIDVTAFASVMVVLVFTLLLAQTTSHPDGVSADLPKVGHPLPMRGANREDALVVAIFRDGKVFFGRDLIMPDELPTEIRKAVSRGAERKVYIRADARVHYGTVLQVLDGVRSAGVENVGFPGRTAPSHCHRSLGGRSMRMWAARLLAQHPLHTTGGPTDTRIFRRFSTSVRYSVFRHWN